MSMHGALTIRTKSFTFPLSGDTAHRRAASSSLQFSVENAPLLLASAFALGWEKVVETH